MKKLLSLLAWICALCIASFSYAQDIWWITVRFCNGTESTKNLNMVLESGKEWEICIDFINGSADDITIKYGFVDGLITADEFKNKACENEWVGDKFGQYVTQDTDHITINAMSSVRQKVKVKFPFWLSWMINWCLTYYVWEETTSSDSMFNILVRKAQFIDILVWWELKRNIKLSEETPFTYVYDKNSKWYDIELWLQNAWNVDENVTVEWTVTNKFWFSKNLQSEEQKILSESAEKIVLKIWKLPRYKMQYNVDLNVISNPNFIFSTDLIPDNLKGPMEIPLHLSIYVFPRSLVYILIWLIVLIILIRWFSKHLKFK